MWYNGMYSVGLSEFEKKGIANGTAGSWVFQPPAANKQRDAGGDLRNRCSQEQRFHG